MTRRPAVKCSPLSLRSHRSPPLPAYIVHHDVDDDTLAYVSTA